MATNDSGLRMTWVRLRVLLRHLEWNKSEHHQTTEMLAGAGLLDYRSAAIKERYQAGRWRTSAKGRRLLQQLLDPLGR